MKVGDVIRIPAGARQAFRMKSDIGMIVGMIPREDKYPDDLEVLVDGIVHAMGFQVKVDPLAEVISEAG
jgi:hypothetical protein